ncbi:MAG: HD domain-containing protein [Lachnospiraceae bacterium]|nr:HD domain-containing protein [Lachnospiraceae bacterium]
MEIDRQKVIKAFKDYVDNYNTTDEKIRLKIEHTYRVSELCESIAQSLQLDGTECDLAWLLGMLHDIGRFEQLRNYGTFIDAQSIDHALYGAEILFEQDRIRDYIEDAVEDKMLRTAVAYHSAYRLPEVLDERTRMFCQILRDADKIDILKVNVDFPLEEIYNVSTDKLLTAEVSEAVMEAFKEGHTVLRSLKRTPADNVVGHISLVYELVYPRSLALVKEQGYIQKLMDFQSKNPKTQGQFEQIRETMKGYLQEAEKGLACRDEGV